MKLLFYTVVIAVAVLLGSATAQYGYPYGYSYGYPYGYPYGYDVSMPMYANPYGYQGYQQGTPGVGYYDPIMGGSDYYATGMIMGYGDPVLAGMIRQTDQGMAAMLQQLDEQMAGLQQQIDQSEAYSNQVLAQIRQYFIDLYRTTTGDQASPDETAQYYGQVIHCQQYPNDCKEAARMAREGADRAAAYGRAMAGAWSRR